MLTLEGYIIPFLEEQIEAGNGYVTAKIVEQLFDENIKQSTVFFIRSTWECVNLCYDNNQQDIKIDPRYSLYIRGGSVTKWLMTYCEILKIIKERMEALDE